MIPMEAVAVITNLTPTGVENWIKSDELHHARSADDAPLICLNSLLKRLQRTTTA